MLLQSHDSFDELADFDPETGSYTTISKSAEAERRSSTWIAGVFSYLGGHRVLLYRQGRSLRIQVDDEAMNLEEISIHLISGESGRTLRFVSEGNVIKEVYYHPVDVVAALADDPTAFVESEDFDFGEFIVNVSRDRDRQNRMFIQP